MLVVQGLCLTVLMLCGASCTARLDISTGDSPPRIVVYGTVTNDYMIQNIELSYSAGFFSREASQRISGAHVTVSTSNVSYIYDEVGESGYYASREPFDGQEGKEYVLRVEVDLDGDGQPEIFRAQTTMPPAVYIEDIKVRKSSAITDRYEILFWGVVPEERGNYLSFSVGRDRVGFSDSLNKYRIIEDRYFGTGYIEGLPCYFLSKESGEILRDGEMVGMKIDVLPAAYGKFLTDAQSELSAAIPLFSGPPANVGTNIVQISGTPVRQPLGFFGANATSTAFAYYYPGDEEGKYGYD